MANVTKKELNSFLKDKDYLVHCAIDELQEDQISDFIQAFNHVFDSTFKSKYQSMKFASTIIKAKTNQSEILKFKAPYFDSEKENLMILLIAYESMFKVWNIELSSDIKNKYLLKIC